MTGSLGSARSSIRGIVTKKRAGMVDGRRWDETSGFPDLNLWNRREDLTSHHEDFLFT